MFHGTFRGSSEIPQKIAVAGERTSRQGSNPPLQPEAPLLAVAHGTSWIREAACISHVGSAARDYAG